MNTNPRHLANLRIRAVRPNDQRDCQLIAVVQFEQIPTVVTMKRFQRGRDA
ncbi:hypothetical protein D3C80_1671330 [compost metagenome]